MNTLQTLYLWEIVLKSIREFFSQRKFHEIVTPLLHPTLPQEPTLYPFQTTSHVQKTPKEFYLACSPERSLKEVLARGVGKCFAISKSFRDLEGEGPLHRPEFLMLEWYREDGDYEIIMADVQKLILRVKAKVDIYAGKNSFDLGGKWGEFSLTELFKKYAQLDFSSIHSDKEFFAQSKKKGYRIEKNTNWEQLFHQIFLNEIYPHLPQTPFFLVDFPSRISPLCKKKENADLAERFELFIKGIELANGNTENTNVKEVRIAFQTEQKKRIKEGEPFLPIDEEFLGALEKMQKKGYSYAGAGLGLEWLMMVMTNKNDIKDVVLAPTI